MGFEKLGPLPGHFFQRHPWVSLTPRSCRRRGIYSVKWEPLLAPLGTGAQSAPLPLPPGPSFSLLTPHYHPLPCLGQGGAQARLEIGRGPGTFCSFLHHWLPGQECVMSPVVVTGLQECGHREAVQGPGRAPGHRPGARRTLGTGSPERTGKDVGGTGGPGGRRGAWPKTTQPREEGKSRW